MATKGKPEPEGERIEGAAGSANEPVEEEEAAAGSHEEVVQEPPEERLPGGHTVPMRVSRGEIISMLLDPKKASALNSPGRWEIPLTEGNYVPGSLKRTFRTRIGFTWITDKELVSVDDDARLVWRVTSPILAAAEIWTFSEGPYGFTFVSIVYEPRELRFPGFIAWKLLASRHCSREARRLLRAVKAALESAGLKDEESESESPG